MKLLRLLISGSGMTLSLGVFITGALIHLALALLQAPSPEGLKQVFVPITVSSLAALVAGLLEGVGAAWFLFFLLHQTVRHAFFRLGLLLFFIVVAISSLGKFFSHLATTAQLVRGTALVVGVFIASFLFFLDLFSSLIFSLFKKLLPHHT